MIFGALTNAIIFKTYILLKNAKANLLMYIANDLTELIGKTPLLRLHRLFPDCPANILAKLEAMNPTSIKDRPALFMIKNAIDAGYIKPGTEVVEATSGNTGIGIASLSAILNFKARFYMIDTSSVERQKLLQLMAQLLYLLQQKSLLPVRVN